MSENASLKGGAIEHLFPSLKRGGSELICELGAKRQQLSTLFDVKDSKADQTFDKMSSTVGFYSEKIPLQQPYTGISYEENNCNVANDDDADQLLNELPTSVDDFQNKELYLKNSKSPYVSQCTSPITNNFDEIRAFNGIAEIYDNVTRSFNNFLDEPPDEEDLEVARINESFEQEQMQYRMYESQNLRSVFYGSDVVYGAEFGETTGNQLSLHNQLQNMILAGNFDNTNLSANSPICQESLFVDNNSPSFTEPIDGDNNSDKGCESTLVAFDNTEEVKKMTYDIIESLLSTSYDDEIECGIRQSVEPTGQMHNRIPTIVQEDENVLSDDMLQNIKDELVSLMDEDEEDAEAYFCQLLKSEEEKPITNETPEPIDSRFDPPLLLNEERMVPLCDSITVTEKSDAKISFPESSVNLGLELDTLCNDGFLSMMKNECFVHWHQTIETGSSDDDGPRYF